MTAALRSTTCNIMHNFETSDLVLEKWNKPEKYQLYNTTHKIEHIVKDSKSLITHPSFLFKDSIRFEASVLEEMKMKYLLKNLQNDAIIKTFNQAFKPPVFENYISPISPLFAENEIILFDDDGINKHV